VWCPSTDSTEISLPQKKKERANIVTKTNSPIIFEFGEIVIMFTSGFISITEKKSRPHSAKDARSGV